MKTCTEKKPESSMLAEGCWMKARYSALSSPIWQEREKTLKAWLKIRRKRKHFVAWQISHLCHSPPLHCVQFCCKFAQVDGRVELTLRLGNIRCPTCNFFLLLWSVSTKVFSTQIVSFLRHWKPAGGSWDNVEHIASLLAETQFIVSAISFHSYSHSSVL